MMGILSFFANPIAVAMLAFGLGGGIGYMKGWDGAMAKYQVASLKEQVSSLKKAAEDTAKQLDEDRKLAEAQEESRSALEAEIEKVLHAPANRSDACRLSGDQLLKLRGYLAKSS